jgi:DNA-directed RNA polymerase subunit RPC12/RpoP
MSRIACRNCGASRSATVVFEDGSGFQVYECMTCGDPTYNQPLDDDERQGVEW